MTYLVFGGDSYYPSGGARDFRAAFAMLDDARVSAEMIYRAHQLDWVQIMSLGNMWEYRGTWDHYTLSNHGLWEISWVEGADSFYKGNENNA